MEAFECPVCLDSVYYNTNRKILYSDFCNHPLCDRCVDNHFGQLGRGQCPQCRHPLTKKNYVERDPEEKALLFESEVRKRVSNIYNDTRVNFENTPAYNDYLEKKEDIINELSFGTDESKKRTLEAELKSYERQNSKHIMENTDIKRDIERSKVREIVRSEGTFYETVKQKLIMKPYESRQTLAHPFQKQYASFFKAERDFLNVTASNSMPKPLDALIKQDTDIPRRKLKSKEEKRKAETAGGFERGILSAYDLFKRDLET